MSNNHEPSNTMTPFNSSTNTPPAPQVSFTLDPSKPLNQSDANSLPTPGSNGAPNSVHGDPDGDSPMTDISFGELKMHKRRRTSSSFDAGHHTLPPNLRQCSSDTNEKMANAPPASMPRIQELLSNPDCSPYYLVCEKSLFPFFSTSGFSFHPCCPYCPVIFVFVFFYLSLLYAQRNKVMKGISVNNSQPTNNLTLIPQKISSKYTVLSR
jgi:hypothetical protein